jgi:predicted PurR-regulated permease PerM
MTPKPFPSISVMAVLRVAVMGLLILSCLKVIQPFLGALTWAAIIAISAWPLFTRLRLRLNGRAKLAAVIIVGTLSLTLAIPIGLMALTLADTIPQLASMSRDLTSIHLPNAPAWVNTLPLVGESLHKFWVSVQLDLPGFIDKIRPAINKAALWALESGASASLSMLEIVLAIVIAGLLLINGDKLWDGAELAISKLGGATADELPEVIARTIRSVTTGVVGTALAQTVLCVIGLLIAGVPGALVLGFLCFIVAVAQLPTLIIWLPAAGWVFYSGRDRHGHFPAGMGLLAGQHHRQRAQAAADQPGRTNALVHHFHGGDWRPAGLGAAGPVHRPYPAGRGLYPVPSLAAAGGLSGACRAAAV